MLSSGRREKEQFIMNILAIISVSRTMGYDSELTCHPKEPGLSWPAPGCTSKWGPLPGDHLARVWLVFLRVSPALQLLVSVGWGETLAPAE